MFKQHSDPGRVRRGFTLVEILVSVLLVTVAASAVLYSLGLAVRIYTRAQVDWRATIELWNRANQTRAGPVPGSQYEKLLLFPGARPIDRTVMAQEGQTAPIEWEVWRAQK